MVPSWLDKAKLTTKLFQLNLTVTTSHVRISEAQYYCSKAVTTRTWLTAQSKHLSLRYNSAWSNNRLAIRNVSLGHLGGHGVEHCREETSLETSTHIKERLSSHLCCSKPCAYWMLPAVPVIVMIRSLGSSVEASILMPHPDCSLPWTRNMMQVPVYWLCATHLDCLILSPPLPIMAPANYTKKATIDSRPWKQRLKDPTSLGMVTCWEITSGPDGIKSKRCQRWQNQHSTIKYMSISPGP